jgi:predicted O-methyltransferase YrrM
MSRTFKHWTPLYVYSRVRWDIDQRLRPHDPWVTRQAIDLLQQLLKSTDKGVEFGSGRSTKWFASRMGHLTSVENMKAWHTKVSADLASFKNVDYRFVDVSGKDGDGGADAYTKVLSEMKNESLDFVLVDGVYRNYCASRALPKIKIGGLLVIDNVNWFLPSASVSPNSRSIAQGPIDDVWLSVHKELQSWRMIWTSSNVSDTAIFIKQ